jgi:hypothetical protein
MCTFIQDDKLKRPVNPFDTCVRHRTASRRCRALLCDHGLVATGVPRGLQIRTAPTQNEDLVPKHKPDKYLRSL